MDPNETMVEETIDNGEADQLPEEIVEETADESQSIGEFIDDAPETDPENKPEPEAKAEPGYVKARVEKAVQKALAERDAQFQAILEQQIEQRIAPLMEKLVESEAQELVRTRKIADIETAREYVKLKQGMPAAPVDDQVQEQPRNEKGQFSSAGDNQSEHEARISKLQNQADAIAAMGGPDVIAEFMNNEDVKMAVIKGEMDFIDLAKQMQTPKKKPPAPARSPNGASGSSKSTIASMTKEQFARLEKKISEGARFNLN